MDNYYKDSKKYIILVYLNKLHTMSHHFPCKIVYCLFVYVGEQFNDDGEYPV